MLHLERTDSMNKLVYIVVVAVLASISGFVYAESVQGELSGQLVRLHVLANSDSQEDQHIKLRVRDEILEDVRNKIGTNADRQAVLDSVGLFEATANEALRQMHVDYTARVEVEQVYFPKKVYGGITLPRGEYYGIRVLLGDGAGENWWCVAYPPLCFTEQTAGELSAEGRALLKKQLSEESYDLISTEGVEIEYKFKLVEVFNGLKERFFEK